MDINANQETKLEIGDEFEKNSPAESVGCRFKEKLYGSIRAHLWTFPLIAAIIMPLSIAAVYISAVLHGHVEPIFPYMSDAGTIGPQAGHFSQMLDILAILVTISAFIRYKQLKYCIQEKMIDSMLQDGKQCDYELIRQLNSVNFVSLLVAIVSSFSIVLPANYRTTEWIHPHAVGAGVMFITMYIYSGLMIFLCNRLATFRIESKPITMTVFTVIGSLSVFISFVGGLGSLIIAKDKIWDSEFRLKWNEQQDGYWWHVVSAVAEWLLAAMFMFYLLCLARRMKRFNQWNKVKFSC